MVAGCMTHITHLHSRTRSGGHMRRRGGKTKAGLLIGSKLHQHVPSKDLQETRGGATKIPLRSRCVSCYARAPTPAGGGRKKMMRGGDLIPNVTKACNVCRKLLCKNCFWNIYDHRCGGNPCDSLILK